MEIDGSLGRWRSSGEGRAAHARDGDRDAAASDADARHRDLTNGARARGCPEKVFALVRARDALAARARWGVETTLRENGGALREWRRATLAKATTGARRAVAETTATTKHEAARVGAGWERAGSETRPNARRRSRRDSRAERGGAPRARRRAPRREDVALRRRRRGDERGGRDEAEETEAEETEAFVPRFAPRATVTGRIPTGSSTSRTRTTRRFSRRRPRRRRARLANSGNESPPSPPPPPPSPPPPPPRTKRRWLRIRHSRRSPPTRSPRRRKRSPRRVPRRLLRARQTAKRRDVRPAAHPRVGGGGARVRRGRRPRGGGNVRVRGVTNRALAIGVVSSFGRDGGGTVERVRVRGVGRRDGGDGNRGRAGPAKHER